MEAQECLVNIFQWFNHIMDDMSQLKSFKTKLGEI